MNATSILLIGGALITTFIFCFVNRSPKYWLPLLIIVALHTASLFLITFQVGDVMLFSDAGYYYRNGIDYYKIDVNHTQYPFFPFLIFFHAFANMLAQTYKMFNFMFYLKILELICLYGLSFIVKRLATKKNQLLFLSSPVTYLTILFHGQIDVILLFFLIQSILFLSSAKNTGKGIIAGLLLGMSVATKTWSVIFLPLLPKFFGIRKTIIVVLSIVSFLAVDIFIYTRTVFNGAFKVVLPAVLKPGGPVGIWGISLVLHPIASILEKYNVYIFGILLGVGQLLIYRKKISLWVSLSALILWVYLIIPNWGVQYLFWVLPFAHLLNKSKLWLGYNLMAGAYMMVNYINVANNGEVISSGQIKILGLVLWVYIWGIFVTQLRGHSKQ